MKKITRYPDLWTWRHTARLTQAEAAKILGISQTYYGRIESGRYVPPCERAKTITAKTGVPLDAIVGVA